MANTPLDEVPAHSSDRNFSSSEPFEAKRPMFLHQRKPDTMAMEPSSTSDDGAFFDDQLVDSSMEKFLLAKRKRKQAKSSLKRFMSFMFFLAVFNAIASLVTVRKALMTGFEVKTVGDDGVDEIFDFARFSYDERRARRVQVLQESTLTNGKLHFDVGVMDESQFNSIQQKCERKKNVVVRKTWEDGSSKLNTVCQLNTSILVKPKKRRKKNKNKNKLIANTAQNNVGKGGSGSRLNKMNSSYGECNDREVIVNTNGYIWNIDCEDCQCYQSGTVLLSRQYEPCDLRYNNDDCQQGLICSKLSKGLVGPNIYARDLTGTCTDPVMAASFAASSDETYRGEGATCEIDLGHFACEEGLFCRPENEDDTFGTCTVEIYSLSSAPKRQQEGFICNMLHGNKACVVGFYCLSSGIDTTSGICTKKENYSVSIPANQDKGNACSILYGAASCKAGLYCIPDGDNASTGVCSLVSVPSIPALQEEGPSPVIPKWQDLNQPCKFIYGNESCSTGLFCLFNNGQDASIGVCARQTDYQVSIQSNQGLGMVCMLNYGLDACTDGLVCISSSGISNGMGVCENVEYQTQIPAKQGVGMACITSYGSNACIDGYICVSNDIKVGRGVCEVNTAVAGPASSTKWYVDWENQQCIRDCEVGRAPNCGGVQPFWESNRYETAEDCCTNHLAWKRFEECIPEYPIL